MIHRFLARQLRRPSGWFGRLVMAPMLNRGNRELLTASLRELRLEVEHAVLDVGFGGGAILERLLADGHRGPLAGVDVSRDMVARARRRFARAISEERLRIELGDVVALPFLEPTIDRVLAVNTVYFWPDLEAALRSIHEVMHPGGRLVVGFTGADKMREFDRIARHGFLPREPRDVEAALEAAGFTEVRVRALAEGRTRGDFLASAKR